MGWGLLGDVGGDSRPPRVCLGGIRAFSKPFVVSEISEIASDFNGDVSDDADERAEDAHGDDAGHCSAPLSFNAA